MIDETVEEIKELQTHSSSVVAVKAAEALRELLDREFVTVEEFTLSLERNSSALRRAQPSHATLFTTQTELVETVREEDVNSVGEAKDRLATAIDRVVERVENGKRLAAENAADVFEDGATVLTHDYSSTVLGAMEAALDDGAEFEVYVTEARPRYLGRKLARSLAGFEGVETRLLTDAACGHYLRECDRVVLGMSCIVGEAYYNRIGTFPLCATASQLDVPVTVLGASSKVIDEGGFQFENEFRSPTEVMREPAEGFDVYNPAYDATPTRLIDEVVTDRGVVTY
ncbi:translation initiation factor eIF-2B [Salinirubellus sp. GCM10025818]|uniref:translation initiation factor eIF-2B n=1 Tax=Salinirubellus TaxID=2162630 RepID=UPI0030CE875B